MNWSKSHEFFFDVKGSCAFPDDKTYYPLIALLKLRTLYGEKHSRFQELEVLIQEKNDTREILTNFITKLQDLTGEQTEFREELWGGLVDHIRIDEKSSTVVFRGSIEITI